MGNLKAIIHFAYWFAVAFTATYAATQQNWTAAVLGILPDAQREVLLMRFIDGMSLQEIAEALNIPLGTVKSRLHNALQTLRSDRRTRDYFLG